MSFPRPRNRACSISQTTSVVDCHWLRLRLIDGSARPLGIAALLLRSGRSSPENDLLQLIDKHIDFGFVRKHLNKSYSDTGRPSIAIGASGLAPNRHPCKSDDRPRAQSLLGKANHPFRLGVHFSAFRPLKVDFGAPRRNYMDIPYMEK